MIFTILESVYDGHFSVTVYKGYLTRCREHVQANLMILKASSLECFFMQEVGRKVHKFTPPSCDLLISYFFLKSRSKHIQMTIVVILKICKHFSPQRHIATIYWRGNLEKRNEKAEVLFINYTGPLYAVSKWSLKIVQQWDT